MSAAGCLIAFEGPEGAGKSTQLQRLADTLRADGWRVETTAEPGGTALGRDLRQLLLHARDTVPVPLAELFLYLADRAQHVQQLIAPAIAAGALVLTDRFSASTIAYQGYGRGLDLDLVTRADAWARGGLAPRLTVLLDCPVRVGLQRARGDNDRFHAEEEAFHERVRAGFHALAAAAPATWRTIDSTQPADAVHTAVLAAVRAALEQP
ncbi:MAG TPA: dTMP kinase [Candidatus Dormibacteraeota bacterium]|nr:dTMP kinase [Candidatus Dormibacteraeota bacterium]